MKILMVCLGNICRSPLAEALLRHKAEQHGLKNIEIDSAGTSGYHAGENPDERSIDSAKRFGLDISNLVSRQFTVNDFDRFDKIYVMDTSNYKDVLSLARNDKDRNKVELMLECTAPGRNACVPDPYFGGEEGFTTVYKLLDNACEKIIQDLKSESKA